MNTLVVQHSLAFLKRSSLRGYRLATWAVLLAGAVILTGVLALRYAVLPNADSFRPFIARAVSAAMGRSVEIERLAGSWRGSRPELMLHGLRIAGPGGQPALELKRVDAVLSWLPLLAGRVRFHSIELRGVSLDVQRDAEGTIWVGGNALRPGAGGREGGFGGWVLAQRRISIRDATLTWTDATRSAPPLVVRGGSLRLDNDELSHRFAISGKPDSEVAASIDVRGVFSAGARDEPDGKRGQVYGALQGADLARLQLWVPVDAMHLDSGRGSVRLWIEVADGRLVSATADASLTQVQAQFAPDVPALALDRFAGRVRWRPHVDGMDVEGERISFITSDGLAFPAADVILQTRSGRSQLTLRSLELQPLAELAERLPIDAQLRERLMAIAPSGRIESAALTWNAPWQSSNPWSAQARFQALAWRPDGVLPGVSGVSGTLAASERGGTVSLRAESGSIALPKVFDEPIPVDFLSGEVDWTVQDGQVQVAIRSASFTNSHAAGQVSGTYLWRAGEKGTADFSAALVRADAKTAWRYIPRIAQHTQAWLKEALLAGTAHDVRVRLKGPLERFPFADDKGGQFEVSARVQDATLAFDGHWPALEHINGRLRFHGAQMDIEAQSAATLGIALSGARVRIPALNSRDPTLMVEGEASGKPQEFLRYLGVSPLEQAALATAKMRAGDGQAKLALSLELPLRRASDAKVTGRVDLSAAQFTVEPRIPPLSAVSATVAFTKDLLTVSNGKGRLYDTPIAFEARNEKAGTTIRLSGRADALAVARATQAPLAGRLEGSADWEADVKLRDQRLQVLATSSLSGMALNLPAPFAKAAGERLPLRIEVVEEAGRPARLSASLGTLATARVVLTEAGPSGEIRLGGEASSPSAPGLAITGYVEALDLDAWQRGSGQSAGADSPALTRVDVSAGTLLWAGRRFNALRVRGEQHAGRWQLTVDGTDVAGSLTWERDSDSAIVGRFSRLRVPEPASSFRPSTADTSDSRSLPALDVIAEDFRLDGKELGRLELQAVPKARIWELERLVVSNPDGRLDAQGKWVFGERSSTELNLTVQAHDIGKLLLRLGYPEGIKGGSGHIAGPITWAGPPYRPDFATLTGQLKLEAANGRFAKLEPGVGKLLGILSLQALPRRLSLDFRDVFHSGFSFDRISADVALSEGIARTDNFRMDGSAARVAMQGKVDLPAETQDLRLKIFPQLSTGVAIAGAIVSPAVGIATLLAQKALGDPVEQLAALEYHVTGEWVAPKIEYVLDKGDTGSARR